MTESFEATLRERMADLERSLSPTREAPSRHRGGLALPAVAALLLIGAAAGTAGAAAIDAVRSSPGVFSQAGALACSSVQDMAPPHADEVLRELGYTVTWQIEDRDAGTSVTATIPPAVGYIQEGVLHGRELLLVVETGDAASPVGPSC